MQSRLRAQRMAFAFSDAVPLFHDVDFDLAPGWTGLVGANGAGKSTLFSLVRGALSPWSGRVFVEPADARIRHCPQEIEALDASIERFGESVDGAARRLHGQLALDLTELHRWSTLSPGERKRWQIGAALFEEPDVLLLDEPTNHLDADARGLLVHSLERFRGIGLLIAHDRELLDALTTRTMRIHASEVTVYAGSYSTAREQWETERRAKLEERESLEARVSVASRRLADARRNQQAAVHQRSAGSRMRSRYDSDARGLGADFRVAQAEKRIGRDVAVTRRTAERARAAVDEVQVEREWGTDFYVQYERAPVSPILALVGEDVRAGDRLLLSDVRLTVGRDDRIRITGPNGAGKSTLLVSFDGTKPDSVDTEVVDAAGAHA